MANVEQLAQQLNALQPKTSSTTLTYAAKVYDCATRALGAASAHSGVPSTSKREKVSLIGRRQGFLVGVYGEVMRAVLLWAGEKETTSSPQPC
eukprot:3918737-Amphidinium_carterae.2